MKKIFRELFIRGNREQLERFIYNISSYVSGNWSIIKDIELLNEFLMFRYKDPDKILDSEVSIMIGFESIKSGELKVSNIVPLKKRKLTIGEYNRILVNFYNNVIKKYCKYDDSIQIVGPTTDTFEINMIMSEAAWDSFKDFCYEADIKGNSDYLDDIEQKKWYEFVKQSYLDDKKLEYDDLVYILTAKSVWTNIKEPPMERRRAKALAHRYELEYDILNYCN